MTIIHHIHKSQINAYLAEMGIPFLQGLQDRALAMHHNTVHLKSRLIMTYKESTSEFLIEFDDKEQ